jgi:hypothetical protein
MPGASFAVSNRKKELVNFLLQISGPGHMLSQFKIAVTQH